jgi:hypothetical protein
MVVSELPDRMAAIALPLGVALVSAAFVGVVVVSAYTIVASFNPGGYATTSTPWMRILLSVNGINLVRAVLGLTLFGLALRAARRGRVATALLLCSVGVMVWARVLRWVTGGVLNAGVGADALNLVSTGLLVTLIGWHLARRTLTTRRSVALGGALVLSGLLGYRDFVSDPVGALLGFSGAALVLFGLTWDLLTDCDIANRGSRRFPVPSRVMLVLANFVLAIAILAYLSLTRDPAGTVNLDDFAGLGDEVLGTGLMAAAFVAIVAAVSRDEEVS